MAGPSENTSPDPAAATTGLLRGATTGALATCHHQTGVPYASLVAVATTPAGEPLVLLSDLALHTRNLKADPRASLLLASAPDNADVLDNPRVTVMGTLIASDCDNDRARYLSRYEDAVRYADFTDFGFYRLAVSDAHYIGGFGRIHTLAAAQIVRPDRQVAEIAAGERDIIEHMNSEHGEATGRLATVLLEAPPGPWRMIGCDTAGCDLRLGRRVLRLDFPEDVETLSAMRSMLARLARRAGAPGGRG